MRLRPVLAATAVLALAVTITGPARAADPASGPAASAESYGLMVDTTVLPSLLPVRQEPVARSAQEYPGASTDPASNRVLGAGPQPSDGSVLNHAGVLTSSASAGGVPDAVAWAEVHDLSLLGATNSLVSADVVRAQSATNCAAAPDATGTILAGLRVNGIPVDNTPAPNTVIDLVVAKVILNEQHPAFDGRGLVVNAIHVVSTMTGDALIRGDVIVAHAMSTVSCPNGAGSTATDSEIQFAKTAAPDVVSPGDQVTYTADVSNTSTSDCVITQFVEHLAAAFEFVSTSGELGDTLDRTQDRPGGGTDLVIGNGVVLAAGATLTQTFVVQVKDDAANAVYYDNLELLCASLGDFVKGLDAPVSVTDETALPRTETPAAPQCSDGMDNDGDGLVDYPDDPGCENATDDDESNDEAALPRTGSPAALWLLGGVCLLGLSVTCRRVVLAPPAR